MQPLSYISRLIILSLLAIFILPHSSSADEKPKSPELKVMSFNIRYGTAKDGDNAWPKRKDSVAAAIIDYEPDILGTQEALPFQVEFLQEHLFDYHVYSHPRTPGGEACAIFFHKEAIFEKIELTH